MDPAKANERVLVIPESRFLAAGAFTGFRAHDAAYMAALLEPSFLSYRPRGLVESDPTFKQLIPYIVLRCASQVFQYTRGRSGTETRLQALRSIGIGGHISAEDAAGASDPYRTGMLREIAEEVEIATPYRERCLGFIYDPSLAVGEVHLGIVHLFDLEEPSARPREDALHQAGFVLLTDLAQKRSEFETWSQLVLDQIS